jgi:nitroreductase
MMSLGCVMENMWLVAQSLGIGFHIQSVMSATSVEREVKRILAVRFDVEPVPASR